MHWIIQEWIAQWLGLRDRLRRPEHEEDGWWLGIRERILRFLVSRYVDEPRGAVAMRVVRSEREVPRSSQQRRTYCRVTAEDHPPRRCADMTGKLRSVSRINANKRRRWRLL